MTTGKRLHTEDEAKERHEATGGLRNWKHGGSLPVLANLEGQKENPQAKNSGLSRNGEQAQLTVSMHQERWLSTGTWN